MSISILRAFPELLQERLSGLVKLTPEQVSVFSRHYELLVRWNRSLNLTSIKSPEEIVERHYCESIFLAMHLPAEALSIGDLGSGAGFPGFPVAVLRPDCRVNLIEGHHRKAVFLRETTRSMTNVRVLAARGEAVAERFDRVISRAVSYEHLEPILKKMASAADLLTGEEAPPPELGFTWNTVALPWGHSRFLRTGILDVSHETS